MPTPRGVLKQPAWTDPLGGSFRWHDMPLDSGGNEQGRMSPEYNSRGDWKAESDTGRAGRTMGKGGRRAGGLGAH